MFDVITVLIVIGVGAGVIGSLVGIGGGIVFIPSLTLLGLNPSQVASTSLIAVTFTGISSTISYVRQKRIIYTIGLKMAIASIPGAVVGAFLSNFISAEFFKLFFAILLIFVVLYIIVFNNNVRKGNHEKEKPLMKKPFLLLYGSAFLAGVLSSLFGIGGGIIFVPVLVILMGLKMNKAAPTSQLIIIISSVTGLIVHVLLGHPDYIYALSLSAGAFIGGIIGAELSAHIKERSLQIFLSVSLLIVSAKLIYDVAYGN